MSHHHPQTLGRKCHHQLQLKAARQREAVLDPVSGKLGKCLVHDHQPELLRTRRLPVAAIIHATKCRELFGPFPTTLEAMTAEVADWIREGGRALGKPTHFEERGGKF